MSALTINGIEVNVLDGSARASVEEIGEKTRAFDGTLRSSRQATKRVITFDAPLNVPSDAEAIRQLLLGTGHAWSFEGQHLYSSKGKGPSEVTGSPTYAAGKFGSYSVQTTDAIGVKWTIPTTAYTVMAWHHDGSAWHHHVYCSDATGGLDGVAGVASEDPAHGFGVAAGEVACGFYTGPAAGTYKTDDLVILPFVIPAAWVAEYYAAATAHGDLPKLAVDGDVLSGFGPLSMIGEVGDISYVQGYVAGVFYDNLQTISVTLSEV